MVNAADTWAFLLVSVVVQLLNHVEAFKHPHQQAHGLSHLEYSNELDDEDYIIDEGEQSPIDIDKVKVTWLDKPLKFSTGWHETPSKVEVVNTGEYVKLNFKTKSRITISGGPLNGKYIFRQLHWHWGKDMKQGSEHELGGRRLPCEGHFVLQADDGTPPIDIDSDQNIADGKFAVIGVLYEPSPKDNKILYAATKNTVKVIKYHTTYNETKNLFPLINYLPKQIYPFFNYPGSLTTEPYSEGVNWIVLSARSHISPNQVAKFRKIKNKAGRRVLSNWRAIQPLGGRTVKLIMGVPGRDANEML